VTGCSPRSGWARLAPGLGRRVAVRLGRPAAFPSLTSLPMTWEPLGLDGLLPRLDADIEVGPLGEGRTQLAISARYRPPFGVVGRTIDRVLLHRVAEATVKDFLDRVGAAIIGQAAASGSGRHRGTAGRGSA
jgi:hypothetical protein